VIAPELVKLAQERPHIRIAKFNCNKANKELVSTMMLGAWAV
jgi:hypothetical protein